jgi:hypothetical protein
MVRRTISATYDRPDPARPYTTAIRADAHARTALSMDPTLNSAVPPPHLLVLVVAPALVLVLALVPAAFAPTGVASSHATHKSLNSTIGSIFVSVFFSGFVFFGFRFFSRFFFRFRFFFGLHFFFSVFFVPARRIPRKKERVRWVCKTKGDQKETKKKDPKKKT